MLKYKRAFIFAVSIFLIIGTAYPQITNFNKKEYLNNLIEVIEKDGGRSYPTTPLQVDPTWEQDVKLYGSLKSFVIHNNNNSGSPTPLDDTWADWLKRTGELPPDFNAMPTIPLLPDPLVMIKGNAKTPITTSEQWKEQKGWIREQAQKWIVGSLPPAPDNLIFKVIKEEKSADVTKQLVELQFGPDHRARLRLVLLIPPGKGPFPVFLTQYNHQSTTLLALRRGYLTCAYAATDDLDDTENWAEIYYPEYDFSRLMRRAWAAGRAIDYLYTLPYVDKAKIGLTGHSRNGKVALYAAAFDERITAVMPAGCGSGSETPWRNTTERYGAEDIRTITGNFPNWYHPRFRFFSGRENKLPIDNNSLLALIAPRGHHNKKDGIYLCWRVQRGIFRNNILYANGDNGISIGHQDTDNVFENNRVYENAHHGVFFRNESEKNSGHRNTFTNNTIENNGIKRESCGFYIGGETHDITITNNVIRSTGKGNQSTAILVGKKSSNVKATNNRIPGSKEVVQEK